MQYIFLIFDVQDFLFPKDVLWNFFDVGRI
jgi:hypothetical protein